MVDKSPVPFGAGLFCFLELTGVMVELLGAEYISICIYTYGLLWGVVFGHRYLGHRFTLIDGDLFLPQRARG